MQPAPHTPPPTGRDMLWETFELLGGFGAMLMPLVALGVPGIVLFLVVPAALVLLLVAIPVLIAAAVIGLPFLLVRAIRRPSTA